MTRALLTLEQILALPVRPCTACCKLVRKVCQRYDVKMQEPERECRCAHFVEKPNG